MANKIYKTQEIELLNGDITTARPLPIKALKELQGVFEEYGDDMRRLAILMTEVAETTRAKQEKKEDPEPYIDEAKERAKVFMKWEDCLLQASLVALKVWTVRNKRKEEVTVDMDYLEDNLDVETAKVLCEIAGSFKLGDLESDELEGKAPEVLKT